MKNGPEKREKRRAPISAHMKYDREQIDHYLETLPNERQTAYHLRGFLKRALERIDQLEMDLEAIRDRDG